MAKYDDDEYDRKLRFLHSLTPEGMDEFYKMMIRRFVRMQYEKIQLQRREMAAARKAAE
jgi:hypothetical protein